MSDNAKKSGPTKSWDDPKVLTELCVALYQALDTSGGLTSSVKEAIPAYLEQQETPLTWSAIRRKTMTWDAKVHEDILIEVFHSVTLSSSDVGKLIGGLHDKGYTFTESALRKSVWNTQSHEDLLLCLIDFVQPGKTVVTELVTRMASKGHTFSYHAINQHIQKLRKTRDTGAITGANGGAKGGTSTPKKGPAKKNPASSTKKRTASGSNKKLSKDAVDDDDDAADDEFNSLVKKEDVMDETPTKKLKKEHASESDGEF